MSIKNFTRIDVFKNADEVLKFYEFAASRGAKTQEELEKALEEYKKADVMVEGCKEHVEAQLMSGMIEAKKNVVMFTKKGKP